MLRFTGSLSLISTAGVLALSAPAWSAISVSTDNEVGPGGAGSTFTPSYVVSSADLINGALPSDSSGDFALEIGGGLPVLTDGAYGTITEPGGAPDRTHLAFATAGGGGGSGTFVTYALDTVANPFGFDLSRIDVFGGWNDSGRDQQLYTVSYSTVADPGAFVDLTSVDFNPAVGADLQSATRVSITEDALPALATGVAAVRFAFDTPSQPENGYVGYAEIDVFGQPTIPEPSTFGLLVLGAAGLLTRRRRGM